MAAIMAVHGVDKAPQWVPDKYKADFVDMANACEAATKQAKELSDVLRSPSEVTGCEQKDKGVLFVSKRGAIEVKWYAEFEKTVKSCEYSNGEMVIKFEGSEPVTFMGVLKYTAIIVGSITLGILVGRSTR
jgi:hypothetical protein